MPVLESEFLQGHVAIGQVVNVYKLKENRSRFAVRKKFFSSETPEQVAQRSRRCTIPGGAQGQGGWALGSLRVPPICRGWN